METVRITDNLAEVVTEISNHRSFAMDLETTGLNPLDSRILLFQLGVGDKAFVIDARKVNVSPLMPFLADDGWKKIIHNAKFEQRFIQHFFKTRINGVFDSFLAEKLIVPGGYENSLAAVSAKYLGKSLEKETRKSFINFTKGTFSEEQIEYAAEDVRVLPGIMAEQANKIAELQLGRVSEVEFELAGVVADMENVGVPINKKKWQELIVETKKQREQSRLRMHEILFDDNGLTEQTALFERDAIDLDSPKQVLEALRKIGLKLKSTDEREIGLINHPAAVELLNFRGLEKILTSYADSFLEKIHGFDNRIHADFQQLGTETGRFACKDPNLQQIPPDFRHCVESEDHMIISCDFSNIELRILAELSDDPALIRAFQSGDDPHKATAATMFNIPISEVSKEQRFTAKTINFGISYGMGTGKLMDMLNKGKPNKEKMSFTEVNRLHKKYKSTYSKAMEWLEATGRKGFREGYSETILGRRRFFRRPDQSRLAPDDYERQLGGLLRQAANSPIQGSNADITKIAMIDLDAKLRDEGWRANIIIQIHDEVVLLAHKQQAEHVKIMTEEVLVSAAEKLIKKVPIKVEAQLATNWIK